MRLRDVLLFGNRCINICQLFGNYITNRTKSKSDCITLVDTDESDVCDPDRISNMFCDYFSSVATNLNNDIPTSNTDPMDYMPPRVHESFFVLPSTPSEIKNLIMSLPNKGFTIDSIPVFIYKKIVDYIAPVFSVLLNKSVSEGIFLLFSKLLESLLSIKANPIKLFQIFVPFQF